MQLKEICVIGGSGFVGSAIVTKLDAAGYKVKVLTRRREVAKHLLLLPHVEVLECNILDNQALRKGIGDSDAVINLIGILHQTRRSSFDLMHHQFPARLAKTCIDLGITRLLHMSSLRAGKHAPSQYLRSKGAGEAALLALVEKSHLSKLNLTIFKPSVIFGRGDRFINLFATLIKVMPVLMLAKPQAKFQPVWVEDVATCFVLSLQNKTSYGQVYELAGPKVYTFRELVKAVMTALGIHRRIIGLNDSLSYFQAALMELMPVKLMSRDNVRSMAVDSISSTPFPVVFGLEPTALEAVIPDYLVDANTRGAYDRFRSLAAR